MRRSSGRSSHIASIARWAQGFCGSKAGSKPQTISGGPTSGVDFGARIPKRTVTSTCLRCGTRASASDRGAGGGAASCREVPSYPPGAVMLCAPRVVQPGTLHACVPMKQSARISHLTSGHAGKAHVMFGSLYTTLPPGQVLLCAPAWSHLLVFSVTAVARPLKLWGPNPLTWGSWKKRLIVTRPVSQFSSASSSISLGTSVVGTADIMEDTAPIHILVSSSACGGADADRRVCTVMSPQASKSKPKLWLWFPWSSVGPRMQVPDHGSAGAGAALAWHQWNMHRTVPFQCAGLWVGGHTTPSLGSVVFRAATVENLSASSAPATWLWPGGKISGMPWSSFAPVMIPTRNTTRHRTVTSSKAQGQAAIQPVSLKSARYMRFSSFAWFGVGAGAASAHRSPAETSTTRCCWTFSVLRWLSTMSGGRKSRTSTKALITQRPMKSPNSRSGCRQLAKFAKKLTEVVSDVARQLFPACASIHTTRSSSLLNWALWFQKSTNTKTTSLPMPRMMKTERKDAMVVFPAGVRTYAMGTEAKMMRKQARLSLRLRMWNHMYSVTNAMDPIAQRMSSISVRVTS
mmetsp:Transcript_117696/g.333580  ORF Transcript_117696/g.333580 Transcript_117696/m.333580 type:complete len:574 (-) Transcript_117696:588-2309(-)